MIVSAAWFRSEIVWDNGDAHCNGSFRVEYGCVLLSCRSLVPCS